MASSCPKCGAALKIYQMSPYCKKCGVHLMFASFEGQFEKDRRIAEMSMANFRYNLVKLKSAYTGSLAQKLRISFAFIPLLALLLPLGSVSVHTPVYEAGFTLNAIDVIMKGIMGGLFGTLGSFAQGPVFGPVADALKTCILGYLVMTAAAVLVLLIGALGFIGNKKASVMMIVFSAIGMVGAVLTKVFGASLVAAGEAAGALVEAKCGMLFLVAMLLFAAPVVAAVLCLKNPPERVFREGDELRVEYRRKWKKGEIDLLSIPAPIYESEEDRAERRRLVSEAYQTNEEVTDNG
ncbi:MAG: hypothetical protein IKJ63_02525 [Clostridia bacterium]|nr:hypothetical protein [Clostridia bacterium]